MLTFLPRRGVPTAVLQKEFDDLWRHLAPLLTHDIEANVEYGAPARTHSYYIRIPWQLYLLAIAARLRPLRRFSSARAQKRLTSIVDAIRHGSFVYPQSGRQMSTRTAAILYDTLGLMASSMAARGAMTRLSEPFRQVDRIRSSRAVRGILATGIALLVAESLREWWLLPSHSLAQLGPELAATFFAAVLLRRRTS